MQRGMRTKSDTYALFAVVRQAAHVLKIPGKHRIRRCRDWRFDNVKWTYSSNYHLYRDYSILWSWSEENSDIKKQTAVCSNYAAKRWLKNPVNRIRGLRFTGFLLYHKPYEQLKMLNSPLFDRIFLSSLIFHVTFCLFFGIYRQEVILDKK